MVWDNEITAYFALDDEESLGTYRACRENEEHERYIDGSKSQDVQIGRPMMLDANHGDDIGGRKMCSFDKHSSVNVILPPNSDIDFSRAELNEDDNDRQFLLTGDKSSFCTPRFSSKNRLNSEHRSGNQQRRRRVIQDDDDDSICIDESQEEYEKPYHEAVNSGTSNQENCETFLTERLKEIRLSSDSKNETTTCSLNTPTDLVALEAKGAWKLENDDYYTLSNNNLSQANLFRVEWPNYQITIKLYKKLYDHQKFGVQWLVSLYAKGTGGILGDDMGLGTLICLSQYSLYTPSISSSTYFIYSLLQWCR